MILGDGPLAHGPEYFDADHVDDPYNPWVVLLTLGKSNTGRVSSPNCRLRGRLARAPRARLAAWKGFVGISR